MAHNDFGEIDGIGHTTQGRYGHNVMGHIIGHSMGAERRGIASGRCYPCLYNNRSALRTHTMADNMAHP